MKDIIGYSKAGYSTWIYHKPSGCLFDAGDGMTSFMKSEVFGIDHIFITHCHQDHVSSLMSFLFSRSFSKGDNQKPLKIYYPLGADGIAKLISYVSGIVEVPFDLQWIGISTDSRIQVARDKFVAPFRTNHHPDLVSFGYQLYEVRKTLKKEFIGCDPSAIINAKNNNIEINDYYCYGILTYAGDTIPLKKYGEFDGGIFIHEATFLNKEDLKYNCHSVLGDVLELSLNMRIDALVLNHTSVRYSLEDYLSKIPTMPFPVYLLWENEFLLAKGS